MKKIFAGIGIGLLFLVVILINIAVAWFIYTTFFTTKDSQSKGSQIQESVSVRDTLSDLKIKAEEDQLRNEYAVEVRDEAEQSSNSFVYLDFNTPAQPLGVQPSAYLRVNQSTNEPFDPTSLALVKERITEMLTQQGFSVSALTLPSDTLNAYVNPSITCSLSGVVGAPSVTLACIDTAVSHKIKETVEEIANKNSASLSNAKYIHYLYGVDASGSNAVAILDTFKEVNIKSNSFVYTYNEGIWTYAGDALSAKPGESGGGKIAAPKKIQMLTEDSVYGPLYLGLLGAKD